MNKVDKIKKKLEELDGGRKMNKLEKKLSEIKRSGMRGEIKEAPSGATTFDKMIIVWLERSKPFLYQVHLWDSKTEKIVGTFN